VGKSTISDAIFFAIFGSPLRNIKKDGIANWINKKECGVTIWFNVIDDGIVSKYALTRTLNPSRVQLIKNGEDVSRTIGKTAESIFDILGTTADMFEQNVILCLKQTEPFLAKTPAIKRKFIEDIFKIEIFGLMTSFVRNDFNETKRLFDMENEKSVELDSSIQFHKRQQEEQANKKKIRVNELESRKNTLIEEIKHLETKISEAKSKTVSSSGESKAQLTESISALKIKEKEVLELDRQYTKVIAVNQTTVLNIKSKIKELEKLSDGMCAYCKQPFSESNIQEKKNLIATYQSDINDCNVILENTAENVKQAQKAKTTIEDMRDELNQKYRAIEIQESEISKLNSEVSQQTNWLNQTNRDLENANKDADSFEGVISELTIRRDTLKATASTYEKKLKLIESAKFVVSDEGVKNFIVKKMLKMLNGRLNYYLKQLDANCTCVFNEYFDETIINNIGRECSYFNFSGGEQTRIDLSMLFTFKDIRRMQSNVFVNMGIYDELLDTSLDSKGIECTLNILKERVMNNQEAIYIISHKNEAVKHATGEIIYLEKENNITRRKTYEQFTDRRAVPTSQDT
jgi:DNA repair exonuclease SbcCD ATPase subunit